MCTNIEVKKYTDIELLNILRDEDLKLGEGNIIVLELLYRIFEKLNKCE
jgi:hypothetical protein